MWISNLSRTAVQNLENGGPSLLEVPYCRKSGTNRWWSAVCGGWQYGVPCNNGFTFVTEPGFIVSSPRAASPNTATPEARGQARVHPQASRQGDQSALEPASRGHRAGCSGHEDQAAGGVGAGSPGEGTDKARGPQPARRTRADSALTARAGGGASGERTRGHAQWEGQRSVRPKSSAPARRR